MADVYNGTIAKLDSAPVEPAKKGQHSDSAINSLAKSGGLVGVGKKAVKSIGGLFKG